MIDKRKTGIVYLLILWIVVTSLAWPAYVLVCTVLGMLAGEAWQLDAWFLVPREQILAHFKQGYVESLVVAIPLGLVAVLDYLLLSRYRVTWWLAGIMLPIAGAILSLAMFPAAANSLPALVGTGLVLAVIHRLVDVLAGSASRGRLR